MTRFTVSALRDARDLAPALGVESRQEVRVPELDASDTGLALMRVRPGQRQAVAHRHDKAEEIYVVVAGFGQIKLDDDVRELKPMDAVRIAPNVIRAVAAGPEGIEYLAFGPRHPDDGETFPVEAFWSR